MVHKIIWSPEAFRTYTATLGYLEKEWTEKEVNNFIARVNQKLNILKLQPLIGRPTGLRKNTHLTIINKRVTLAYTYKASKKEIELVSFWNNYLDPEKRNW